MNKAFSFIYYFASNFDSELGTPNFATRSYTKYG